MTGLLHCDGAILQLACRWLCVVHMCIAGFSVRCMYADLGVSHMCRSQ